MTITLYTTTCAGTVKVKTDISRIKHILDLKKFDYEEVINPT